MGCKTGQQTKTPREGGSGGAADPGDVVSVSLLDDAFLTSVQNGDAFLKGLLLRSN